MEESKKIIQIKNVVKNFDDTVVLKGVSLDIYDNEFVTLLGPSGCGKTTLLRILGGFVDPSSGEVLFNNEDILSLPPYKRDINTVFQKYALFPHLNVYDNVAFGLKLKKMPKDVIDRKVRRMLKLVNLDDYGKRNINEMSGGQQQRIAIARALVNEPTVLLLDEPLAALDLKLRKEMQIELKRIQQEVGITFIFVTHDQEEALTMSDKIVVMNNGTLGMVRQWQTLFYGERYSETTLDRGPDFKKLAEAYFVDGYTATTKPEFDAAIASALSKGKPAVIDAHIDPDEFVLPMVSPGKPISEILTENVKRVK